jgi:VanZ family protein
MRLLIAFVYFLIAYGSLFPFHFSAEEFSQHYDQLLSIQVSGIGDVLGNILLFIPLGFLYALNNSAESRQQTKHIYMLWFYVFIFAFVLQFLQIAMPERDQNVLDVLFNMAGFALGYIGISAVNTQAINIQPQLKYLPTMIALTYILSELSPFVPTIDLQSVKDSLKPLLIQPTLTLVLDVFIKSTIWLIVIRLLSFQQAKAPIKLIVGIWGLMLCAKIIIIFNVLVIADIIAPLFAIAIAATINLNQEKVTKVLLPLLLVAFGVSSLATIDSSYLSLETLIPFQSYLNGQLYSGIAALLFKLFIFLSVIWLAIELGKNAKKIACLLAFYVFFIELSQLYMPTRMTDFGDVFLVVISYLTVRNLGDYLASVELNSVIPSTTASVSTKIPQDNEPTVPYKLGSVFTPLQQYCGLFILCFALFYTAVNIALELPRVPYNIAELFSNNASALDLFFFSLFLLFLGGGSGYITQKLLIENDVNILKFISLHCLTLTLTFICLYLSVTIESLEDLVGSSKLSQSLYRNQTSDHFIAMLVNVLSLSLMAKVAQFFEFIFRFIALYGLVQIPLTMTLLIFPTVNKKFKLVKYIVTSIVILPLCLYVTFYAAVTDNLTELIASPIMLSLSLVILAAAIAIEWKFLNQKKYIISFALIGSTSVCSWFIAQGVFELQIVKYGYIFSAFDFLIGAGRVEKLSEITLMLRWSLILTAFQCLLLSGLFALKHLPNVSLPYQVAKIKAHHVYLVCLLIIVGYVGNRLFGEHLHWQTLVQHFTQDSERSFNLDDSEAQVPDIITRGIIYLNGKPVENLVKAFAKAKDHDTIRLTRGYYQQAAVLKASHVSIIAEPGAVIFGKTKQSKGALVIKGDDNYIEGLECHSIYVSDNNGVCIRLEGKGITLNNVYFHHAQGGLLGSKKGGDIVIENSRFEHLGDDAFYHGIYTLAPSRLFINNSYFLNNRNGGHEIKSRSTHTKITHSIIASSQSRDSRLIDVPNGGSLIIKDNILIEGPFSENHDLLSWGVEGIKHPSERVIIKDNIIISDKSQAKLITLKKQPSTFIVEGNFVVGNVKGINERENFFFENREALSIKPAPFIPELDNN